MAEKGDGTASEASEWENREREEQLALLRGRGEAGGGGTRRITVHFLLSLFIFPWSFICLSFVIQLLAVGAEFIF